MVQEKLCCLYKVYKNPLVTLSLGGKYVGITWNEYYSYPTWQWNDIAKSTGFCYIENRLKSSSSCKYSHLKYIFVMCDDLHSIDGQLNAFKLESIVFSFLPLYSAN